MAILAVNAGSSTLKFSIYPLAGERVQGSVLGGSILGLQPGGSPVLEWTHQGAQHHRTLPWDPNGPSDPFGQALQTLKALLLSAPALPALKAIAHRVVHGGPDYTRSVRVTPEVQARLAKLNALAPLHQPNNLRGIAAFEAAFPGLAQVACFDTAFHATLTPPNYAFALPQSLSQQGVRRYGFHGLSYQYLMGVLQQRSPRAGGRVLMAHLGNGASLCAAMDGRSCATTMGFSALDGLMMGTRSGALDPGVLLYLLEQGWDLARLQNLLYRQSGLLGVSGISADMRQLRQNASPEAAFAIDLFTHHVVRECGAMVACMQGLEVLAFSGGIGEHDAVLRAQVCARLGWLGVALEPTLNQQANGTAVQAIHHPESRVEVWVIPTDEGWVAAQETAALILATKST